jgi:hypothetical protein
MYFASVILHGNVPGHYPTSKGLFVNQFLDYSRVPIHHRSCESLFSSLLFQRLHNGIRYLISQIRPLYLHLVVMTRIFLYVASESPAHSAGADIDGLLDPETIDCSRLYLPLSIGVAPSSYCTCCSGWVLCCDSMLSA